MKYAVITSGGKQYKVSEGDMLMVDRLSVDVGMSHAFDVLLFVNGDLKIGAPTLNDVTVLGKVVEHTKGEKIRIAKFKAKAKYRRVTGFRAYLTKVQIESISLQGGEAKKEIKESAPKKPRAKTS